MGGLIMADKETANITVICPCCSASLTIDPVLSAVLDHKLPPKPQLVDHLKDAVQYVKAEASKRDEKYQQVAAAEKNKSKVLEAKFQELFKKAKEEPITKPIKDIDLD
jgi:hypothetical protein